MARMNSARPTEFRLEAPQAKRVSLAGTFNSWDTKKLSAKRDPRGNWVVELDLKPGRYEYKFIVDGKWVNDPRCSSCAPNAFGTQNCVIEVK